MLMLSTTTLQVSLAEATRSNSHMADVLSTYQACFGDWRVMLSEHEAYQALTKNDLQDAAQSVCTPDNSFEALVPKA
jgi:predicted Zn-dependent peptidase